VVTGAASEHIDINDVSFTYPRRSIPALDMVNAHWPRGVTALLGANGSGKTTLMTIVAGLRRPTSGEVSAADGTAQSVGYLPQDAGWPPSFTVGELLEYTVWWRRVPRNQRSTACRRAAEAVGLGHRERAKIGELSGGQRRRAMIAQAMVHSPRLLILDEPTAGLDPEQRVGVRETLASLKDTTTVIISTHIIDDVDRICDHVTVLNDGASVFDGDVAAFLSPGGTPASRDDGRSRMERSYLQVLADARASGTQR